MKPFTVRTTTITTNDKEVCTDSHKKRYVGTYLLTYIFSQMCDFCLFIHAYPESGKQCRIVS